MHALWGGLGRRAVRLGRIGKAGVFCVVILCWWAIGLVGVWRLGSRSRHGTIDG